MKEHPILFSAPMVRALLAGTKSQTRRIVTRTNSLVNGSACNAASWASLDFQSDRVFVDGGPSPAGNPGPYLHVPRQDDETVHRIYPRWQPDDSLWVKEAWRVGKGYDEVAGSQFTTQFVNYEAGGKPHYDIVTGRYRHARFMPRWASRITLRVTDVRIERLQAISESDAIAEGVLPIEPEREEHDWSLCGRCGGTLLYNDASSGGMRFDCDCFECDTYVKRYRWLWDSINGRGAWNLSPWVWVIQFRRM